MTRKLTLFLVCTFEIALILFVAAWTAKADWPQEFDGIKLGQVCDKHIQRNFDGGYLSADCASYKVNKIKSVWVCFRVFTFAELQSAILSKFDSSKWKAVTEEKKVKTWLFPEKNMSEFPEFVGYVSLLDSFSTRCASSLIIRDLEVEREELKAYKVQEMLRKNELIEKIR